MKTLLRSVRLVFVALAGILAGYVTFCTLVFAYRAAWAVSLGRAVDGKWVISHCISPLMILQVLAGNGRAFRHSATADDWACYALAVLGSWFFVHESIKAESQV